MDRMVRLFLDNALCEINWADGMKMQTFVHATEPVGWFVFKNLKEELIPELVAPKYKKTSESEAVNSVEGQDLQRLGYQQGDVVATDNQITYHQKGYGDFYYDVVVVGRGQLEMMSCKYSILHMIKRTQKKRKKRKQKSSMVNYKNMHILNDKV